MEDLCDCCRPGQQCLELQSDRPHTIDHGNAASVIKENKTSRYHFSNALLPSRKHQCAAGLHRRRRGERTKERMEMMLWRLAAVKLLVKTVRFTVSISTFSLCRSMGSFSTTSIPRRSVQFAPLRTPFIAAALEDVA